jgi:hypothetical protein
LRSSVCLISWSALSRPQRTWLGKFIFHLLNRRLKCCCCRPTIAGYGSDLGIIFYKLDHPLTCVSTVWDHWYNCLVVKWHYLWQNKFNRLPLCSISWYAPVDMKHQAVQHLLTRWKMQTSDYWVLQCDGNGWLVSGGLVVNW